MPTPTDGETESEFLERCMSDPEANEDFPEDNQRFAFCQAVWERKGIDSEEEIKYLMQDER